MSESLDPTVLDSIGSLFSKTFGPRQGQPLTVVQVFDSVLVVGGGVGAVAVLMSLLRRRRTSR
jgi:hypothetical protein